MRPFCCLRCDVGWFAWDKESNCFECGQPGFTSYAHDPRQHNGISPLGWDMLFNAARKEQACG